MQDTALAPIGIKLSPVRRLALADHLIDLCVAALLLRHDQADRLARLRAPQFHSGRTDALLLRAVGSLTGFVRERAEAGIVLPEHHRCYVAPPADVDLFRPWAAQENA